MGLKHNYNHVLIDYNIILSIMLLFDFSVLLLFYLILNEYRFYYL